MLKEGSLYHRKWYSSAAGPWEDRPGEKQEAPPAALTRGGPFVLTIRTTTHCDRLVPPELRMVIATVAQTYRLTVTLETRAFAMPGYQTLLCVVRLSAVANRPHPIVGAVNVLRRGLSAGALPAAGRGGCATSPAPSGTDAERAVEPSNKSLREPEASLGVGVFGMSASYA